jgi:hypothetical protein
MRSCRIESEALRAAESTNASQRTHQSEERLIDSMERHINHVLKRKGVSKTITFTPKQRERARMRIREAADTASAL